MLALVICAVLLLTVPACKKTKAPDNFVHVDVYGQMNSRYEGILTSRLRAFSHARATLPSGRKILVGEVLEATFYDRLADPAYRQQAQMLILNSEQETSVDPNLATEFAHARKGCTEQIPCYFLIPNSVSGEQREAAQQLLDYLAPEAAAPASPAPAAAPSSEPASAQ